MPINVQTIALIGVTITLIGIDVVVRYLQVLLHKQWDWSKAGQFVGSHILPQVGGLILAAVSQYLSQHAGPPSFWTSLGAGAANALFYGGATAIDVSLIHDIITKLQSFGISGSTQPQSPSDSSKGAA